MSAWRMAPSGTDYLVPSARIETMQNLPRPSPARAPDPAPPTETGRPDGILVREARAGHTEAYGELVRRYQDRVYNLIFGLVQNHDDALDLTQDVFVRAHTSLSRFREDAVFYTWLYRIALNACIDFKRRKKRFTEPFSLDGDRLGDTGFEAPDRRPSSQPDRALENKELGRLLRRAIADLPEPLRIAIVLHDVDGLQQKEIAALLNCPIGTVKSRIQRGRYELRLKLLPFVECDR